MKDMTKDLLLQRIDQEISTAKTGFMPGYSEQYYARLEGKIEALEEMRADVERLP